MNFIIDKTMPSKLIYNLRKYGNVYKSTRISSEDKAIASHPDLQIHFVSESICICPPSTYNYYAKLLPDTIEIIRGDIDIDITYPKICAYNIAKVGKYIICNTNITDSKILTYYKKNNYIIIHVNQGYSKCNVCPVTSKCFITEDIGIYNATKNINDLDVCLIEKGEVALKGYKYGFIGGATGLSNGKLFCSGKLKKNINVLNNLVDKCNVEIIELSNDAPYDYGSILSF